MIDKAPGRPVVLIVMDGFGVNPSRLNNAVAAAETPHLDACFAHFSHTTLHASGPAVGLPDGQMGNSQVGHLTIGCGSVIRRDIVAIDDAIADRSFFTNPVFVDAMVRAHRARRPLHLLGLVSDGGVHSQMGHLHALIRMCKEARVQPLLHMITDGRDTAPKASVSFLRRVEAELHEAGGAVASIMGRYYAMDRDQRWERTELAWRALVLGKGQTAAGADSAIRAAWAAGDTDEFIQPILLPTFLPVGAEDEVVFFNFRKDRPKQIVSALALKEFTGFDRGDAALPNVTCMMPYDKEFGLPYAFEPERPDVTLGQVISEAGLQLMGLGQPAAMAGRSLLLRSLEPVAREESIRTAA